MKIIVALQNEIIIKKLSDIYVDQVYIHDIDTMEILIELLAKQNEAFIIITKDNLPGNLNSRMFIKQIRLASPNSRVIYMVENLDDEYKSFLFANEIFSIIEGKSITIDKLKDIIEQDKMVVYRANDNKISEPTVEYNIKNNVITKQLIAVYGTSGAGKSTCSSIIAKNIVRDINISVSLLDMDLQNSATDIVNNTSGNNNMLIELVEDVDNSIEIGSQIGKYLVKDETDKKLSYMTSNCSIFDCQNRLSNMYYNKIYESMHNNFDYTIVDLPSSPFLDVVPYTLNIATKILFILNPNYISIRQAIKYLDLITKLWDIPQEKIMIIVNKVNKYSLDNSQITSLIPDYQIASTIEYDENIEGYINGVISNKYKSINLESLYSNLNIQSNRASETKNSLSKLIFKKFGGIKVGN